MTRLPTPGQDSGQWGAILNDFLSQTHTSTGTLRPGVVSSDHIANNTITTENIKDGAITSTKLANDAVTPAAIGAAPALVLPAGSGTDDAAAINTILAAASGKRVRGLPGETYRLGSPMTLPDGGNVELDMTGCTIILNSGADCQMLRNWSSTQEAGTDTNITVIGGAWQRGTVGGTGNDSHSIMFQRVNGLRVRDITYTSTSGSKYGILLYACTNFDVGNCAFATISDGVHLSGACSHGWVHDISGSTGDDSVSLTPIDYAAYQDGDLGDIHDITVERIRTTNTVNGNACRVVCGTGYVIYNVYIRDVHANSPGSAVAAGGDLGQAETHGGTIHHLVVENVDNIGAGHNVAIGSDTTMHGIILRNISAVAGSGYAALYISGGLTARDVTVESCDFTPPASTYAIKFDSGASPNTIDTLRIVNCRLRVATKTAGLINTVAAPNVISNLFVSGYSCEQATWAIADFFGGTTNLYLANVKTATSADVSALFNLRAGGTVKVFGASGCNVVANIGNAGTVNSYDFGFTMNAALLTRVANGMATNTNAALACGAGPIICDGTNWKHLFTGAIY